MRWSQERRGRVAVLAAIVLAAVTSCAAPASTSAVASSTGGGATLGSSTPAADRSATDTEVTFESAGVTVHGTLRRPASGGAAVPAVVLLAGSGPTDRNGDSKVSAGSIGTLSWLADQFAAEGVASLRYDKLGTGATGMADFARHPNDVGFDVFVGEARDALTFLAAQPGIDASKLVIAGHSEGGLIALVVATDPGSAPAPVAQALFSPPTGRYLDLLRAQLKAQTAAAVAQGAMSRVTKSSYDGIIDRAVQAVRAGSPLPADLPSQLTSLFNPSTSKFLQQGDRIDPKALAARLGRPGGTLLTCAEKDIQVACVGVADLGAAFPAGAATLVTLAGTDHVLKDVTNAKADGSEYTTKLPFTTDLAAPLHAFVAHLH